MKLINIFVGHWKCWDYWLTWYASSILSLESDWSMLEVTEVKHGMEWKSLGCKIVVFW